MLALAMSNMANRILFRTMEALIAVFQQLVIINEQTGYNMINTANFLTIHIEP